MLESITLKEVPFDWDDEESINYNGVGGDYNFEIIANKTYTIGILRIPILIITHLLMKI